MNGEADCYGKNANDLQENILIENNKISGTLKYVTDFTKAFGESEKDGNFLALLFDEVSDGVSVKTKVINGVHDTYIDCTADKFCIYRITDEQTQSIEIVAEKGGKIDTRLYNLSGLTLLK